MKFTVEIDCDNAAFGDNLAEVSSEVSRILTKLAKSVRAEAAWGHLRDANGNRVGRWDFIA